MEEHKSLKELAWDVSEEVYRADPALSYSTLSRFQREGFRRLDHLFDKISSPSLTFGSAVDTLMTEGYQAFGEKYNVCIFPDISDALKEVATALFNFRNDTGNRYPSLKDIQDSDIARIAAECGYYSADKYASYRVKLVRENCSEYYDLLIVSEGKQILSQKDYEDALSCYSELRTNPLTRDYFVIDPFDKDHENLFQLKFRFNYEGIDYRIMPDCLLVDHVNKLITPVDLKTTGHPEEAFQDSFYTWRYFIQAQLYTACLSDIIHKDDYFKDFTIKEYEFIVINRNTLAPLIWKYGNNKSTLETITPDKEVVPNWRTLGRELTHYLSRKGREGTIKYSEDMIEMGCKPIIQSFYL